MHLFFKSLIGFVSIGSLTGASFAINRFYKSESIENYLQKIKKQNRVFLSSKTSGLDSILVAYENSKRFKPKDDKGNEINKNHLVEWCERNIKGIYYGKDDPNFKGIESWCYININSFSEQIKLEKNKKISEKASTDKEWTDAWNDYQNGRSEKNLKITDKERQTSLDGSEVVNGAKALSEWCKLKIKLYLDDAEEEFNKFDRWCPKIDAT